MNSILVFCYLDMCIFYYCDNKWHIILFVAFFTKYDSINISYIATLSVILTNCVKVHCNYVLYFIELPFTVQLQSDQYLSSPVF